MATAKLVLPDGTQVTIEGSADEVAALLGRFSRAGSRGEAAPGKRSGRSRRKKVPARAPAPKRKGPTDYIRELIEEGYFATKHDIGSVNKKLEERGQIYPVTSISGPLFRLVRRRELRRLKEDGIWKYVNA